MKKRVLILLLLSFFIFHFTPAARADNRRVLPAPVLPQAPELAFTKYDLSQAQQNVYRQFIRGKIIHQ